MKDTEIQQEKKNDLHKTYRLRHNDDDAQADFLSSNKIETTKK